MEGKLSKEMETPKKNQTAIQGNERTSEVIITSPKDSKKQRTKSKDPVGKN